MTHNISLGRRKVSHERNEIEEFSLEWYMILHRQARNSIALNLETDCETTLLSQKKDSYTDAVYSQSRRSGY